MRATALVDKVKRVGHEVDRTFGGEYEAREDEAAAERAEDRRRRLITAARAFRTLRGQRQRRTEQVRVAITGGTGFVGSNTARALLAAGHEVVLVSRGTRRVAPREGLRVVRADVIAGDGLAEAFAGCDAVVHLTAIIREKGKQTFDAVIRRGTENVVAAASTAGVGTSRVCQRHRRRPRSALSRTTTPSGWRSSRCGPAACPSPSCAPA